MPLISPVFRFNSTLSDMQQAPDLAVLADGRIVAVWTDFSRIDDPLIRSDIRARLINADGSADAADFVVNGEPDNLPAFGNRAQSAAAVTALEGGGFAVSWADTRGSNDSALLSSTVVQRFAADGGRAGEAAVIFPFTDLEGNALRASLSDIVGTASGGYMVAATTTANSTSFLPFDSPSKIPLAVLRGDGSVLDGPLSASASTAGDQSDPAFARLSTGRIAVAYRGDADLALFNGARDIRITLLDSSGHVIGDEIVIPVGWTVGSGDQPRIAALAEGRMVVVWEESPTPEQNLAGVGTRIHARIVNADGSLAGPPLVVAAQDGVRMYDPDVAALPDGSFAVAWVVPDANFQPSGRVMVQLYDAAGEAAGPALALSGEATGDIRPRIAATPDGRYVVTWQATSPPAETGGSSGPEILGQFVDPRGAAVNWTGGDPAEQFVGTDFNDTLAGGAGEDRLWGGTGADILRGGAGGDRLHGGDGTDTLDGGEGDDFLYGGDSEADLRDVIFGGAGHDSADGGAGNDSLSGGSGRDTLVGGLGSDTLVGNEENDLLAGGGGSDLMFGNDGNDTLNGGFGYDRLNGGAGADAFFHLGVADHGSDWIQDYTAAQGDVLSLGIAGATAAQFQVNYANTPGAGDAGVAEAFVIYRPTGQILYALVDGAAQDQINILIGGQVFDLL